MKIKLISMVMLLIVFYVSCEKESSKTENSKTDENNDTRLAIDSSLIAVIDTLTISLTDCLSKTKSFHSDPPSIQLIGQEPDVLLIKMMNTELNCMTDSISLDVINDLDSMGIEIIDNGPYAFCFCPHNIEFSLSSLQNKDYYLTLIESESAYSRDTFYVTFKYSVQLDTVIISY